jgi:hypothetical protein
MQPGCIDRLARAPFEAGLDGGDRAVDDADVNVRAPGRGDHGAATNEEVEVAQRLPSPAAETGRR